MKLEELKAKLIDNNVPEEWYSLDEGLKPGADIIYKNYLIWECYYLDDRGEKTDYRIFNNEEDACNYHWKKMERYLDLFNIKKKKNE